MDNELVSIIVPIYNVELYLRKCLDSIINQLYKNIEIILVDDGSTDNSGIICDEYSAVDKRIIVIHKSNGGLSDARNAGLSIAKGEYIYFIDSDDFIADNTILELYSNAKINKSDITMGSLVYIDEEKVLYIQKIDNSLINMNDISKSFFYYEALFNPSFIVSAVNKLYKKSFIEKSNVKFEYNDEIYAEDYLFNSKLLQNLKSLSIVKSANYYYYQNSNSIMHTYKKNLSYRYINLINSLEKYYKECLQIDDYNYILFFTLFHAFHNVSLNEFENTEAPFIKIYNIFKSLLKDNTFKLIRKKIRLINVSINISILNRLFFVLFFFFFKHNLVYCLSFLFYIKLRIKN